MLYFDFFSLYFIWITYVVYIEVFSRSFFILGISVRFGDLLVIIGVFYTLVDGFKEKFCIYVVSVMFV